MAVIIDDEELEERLQKLRGENWKINKMGLNNNYFRGRLELLHNIEKETKRLTDSIENNFDD